MSDKINTLNDETKKIETDQIPRVEQLIEINAE